jgi:spoIIIJ-associated protein
VEWVEVTGKTVEEAKDAALDQLGVDEAEAEFEILEEPRAGLFGRLRSEARVRARVLPSVPRPKLDRRERRRSRRQRVEGRGDESSTDQADDQTTVGGALMNSYEEPLNGGESDEDEVEVAEAFVTGLLETFGASFTLERRSLDDDLVELSVRGEGLGLLIGPRGQTLAAVQELARTVVQRKSRGRAGRVVIDVAGYRQARREALERFAQDVAEQVRASGVARVLEPMPPPDRKVVHDAVNPLEGVTTTSEGEEPRRRVVIVPESGAGPGAGSSGSGSGAGAGPAGRPPPPVDPVAGSGEG